MRKFLHCLYTIYLGCFPICTCENVFAMFMNYLFSFFKNLFMWESFWHLYTIYFVSLNLYIQFLQCLNTIYFVYLNLNNEKVFVMLVLNLFCFFKFVKWEFFFNICTQFNLFLKICTVKKFLQCLYTVSFVSLNLFMWKSFCTIIFYFFICSYKKNFATLGTLSILFLSMCMDEKVVTMLEHDLFVDMRIFEQFICTIHFFVFVFLLNFTQSMTMIFHSFLICLNLCV